ncbi:unnamed protein product [Tenebrio molitor]|nr:unnamed protein product [Tenebrio molitor]
MFICNASIIFVTELSYLVCALKFLCISIITGTGESLIFYYLMTTSTILKQINYSLKQLNTISFNDTKNILQVYFDLKKDIQNISQIFVFFKVIYTTVELAAILYQLFSRQEDDAQIFNFVTVFYWFLITLEMLLMLYPFVYYYVQNDLFYLQVELTDMKFTTHGLFVLDWPLIYFIIASITTHLIYLLQFTQMSGDSLNSKF